MERVGARELKQHTGEVIARIQRGERLLLTHRGSPIAVISPINQDAIEDTITHEARRAESLGWLALSEPTFDFWDNEDDSVWDTVETN